MPTVIYQPLERQTSAQRNLAQAVPRAARVRMFVRVVGAGESQLTGDQAVYFHTAMLEEPTVSHGIALEEVPTLGDFPRCWAGVISYIKNDLNLYVGAELGFRIECSNTNIAVRFSLTFEGHALRSTAGIGQQQVAP